MSRDPGKGQSPSPKPDLLAQCQSFIDIGPPHLVEGDIDNPVGKLHLHMQRRVWTGDPIRLRAEELIRFPRLQHRSDEAAAKLRLVFRDDSVDDLAGFAFEELEAFLLTDAVNDD